MKAKILSLAFVSLITTLKAQQTETRQLSAFNKIQVSDAIKVRYTTSDTLELKITGKESQIKNIETKVENNTLLISGKGSFDEGTYVYVKNNNLTEVLTNGASTFRTMNVLKNDSVSFSASGASYMVLILDNKKVFTTLSGASSASLAGTTDNLIVEASGASSLKAYSLNAKSANVTSTGASVVKVNVSDKLNATASGASSIKVKGDAKDMNAESTSGASVTRIVDNKSTETGRDSTTIHWKGKKIIIIGDNSNDNDMRIDVKPSTPEFEHWAGFSVGVNGLLSSAGDFNQPKPYGYLDLNYSRSINFQLNFFQHNFHIYKDYINLVTGFGIEWRRYMLDNKTTLNPDSSFTWGVIDSTKTFAYNKNLLKSTMLQVPLLLEFNTSKMPSKSFHIAVGAVGQFMVNSKTKQKLEKDGDDYTKIRKDTYNMAPLQVKAHASIGYSNFTVFGEYNITPLFDGNKGPKTYPFVIGLRVVPFS